MTTLKLLRESDYGLYPKNTPVMVHMGGGKVKNGHYIRKGRTMHHVKVDGELHSVPQDDIASMTGGSWNWGKEEEINVIQTIPH